MQASDVAIVNRAATYRNLADYERTWDAPLDVVEAAFAEVEGLVTRIETMLAAGGWLPQLPVAGR